MHTVELQNVFTKSGNEIPISMNHSYIQDTEETFEIVDSVESKIGHHHYRTGLVISDVLHDILGFL